jgi:hypothetical protein
MRVQLLLQKIHIYGGLACFWYLLILGVSSLQFNHHFEFLDDSGSMVVVEQRTLAADLNQDDLKLAEAIRDSLSLMGWPLPWEMSRDSTSFSFGMEQPAEKYFITYTFADNTLQVLRTQHGFWRVFNSLHGAGSVPNGPFTMVWKWYTRATVMIVIVSIVTGLYIWITSGGVKKTKLYISGDDLVPTDTKSSPHGHTHTGYVHLHVLHHGFYHDLRRNFPTKECQG